LRGRDYEQDDEILTGDEWAGGADGIRAPGGIRLAVGGDGHDCSQIGCTVETLRKWVRQAERDQELRAGLTSDEQERLKALERENRELKRANEILGKAPAFFARAEIDRR